MWQAIGHVLPIAVAVALSSVPILATVLILLSPNRGRSAVPFLIGWVVGLVVVVVALTLLTSIVPTSSAHKPQLGAAIGEILVGLALVVLAVISWRRDAPGRAALREKGASAPAEEAADEFSGPRWLRAASSLGPWSSFGFAFALNLRPKAILLATATGLTIRADGVNVADSAIAIGVYTVISASTVAGPIIATLVAPERAQGRLLSTRQWLGRNGRTVAIVIMLMIGVVVIGNGLTRL